jgi:hypothetical protein
MRVAKDLFPEISGGQLKSLATNTLAQSNQQEFVASTQMQR